MYSEVQFRRDMMILAKDPFKEVERLMSKCATIRAALERQVDLRQIMLHVDQFGPGPGHQAAACVADDGQAA